MDLRHSAAAIAALAASVGLIACGGSTSITTGSDDAGGLPDVITGGDGGDGGDGSRGDGDAACTPHGPEKKLPLERVDLLLMIDSSQSMAGKQEYLAKAVPDLVRRLVTPDCLDGSGHVVGRADAQGVCAAGQPEVTPTRDLHVGIVTSSLGSRLGDVCVPTAGGQQHYDDRGRLINRGGADEHAIADMTASNYLGYFPDVPGNAGAPGPTPAIKDIAKLEADFADAVTGVHGLGCGVESQLESWYRFLVQPDPYDHLELQAGRAKWVGVDDALLQQRADFLRPDSVVLIVDLSDENDSEIDVRALGGQGWNWMATSFQPPRGTSACDTNPADPACTSCKLADAATQANDPSCKKGPYPASPSDPGFDVNLRHVHMKQKYGIDLQFPLWRYVNGLQSPKVPDRDGEYPPGKSSYVGTNDCTNPLFAARLPSGAGAELCHLPAGARTPSMVLFAHIGGVPSQLLHFDPHDPAANRLTDADWVRIVGKNPLGYDYSGIDSHMIESVTPRPGLPAPSSPDDSDPIHGREWTTGGAFQVDLQYACTFPLAAPIDCTKAANQDSCDCPSSPGVPHDRIPPLCDPNDPTKQIRAKAYPSVRELLLAQKLGSQGVVASICPVHTTEQTPGDPLFGYRPAVSMILDRLRTATIGYEPCGE